MTYIAPIDIVLALTAALAGLWAGRLHVRTLRKVTDLLLAGQMRGVALQLVRFAALAGFLLLCALVGPPVLVGAATGVIVGRARALGRERA